MQQTAHANNPMQYITPISVQTWRYKQMQSLIPACTWKHTHAWNEAYVYENTNAWTHMHNDEVVYNKHM